MKDLKNLFKHAVFLLAIAIAVAGCDNPINEDDTTDFYYNILGEKVIFKIRKDKVAVLCKSLTDAAALYKNPVFISAICIGSVGQDYVIGTIDPEKTKLDYFLMMPEVVGATYGLQYNNDTSLYYPCNHICVKLKEGYSIKEALDKVGLTKSVIRINVSTTSYMINLDVKLGDILRISRMLFESGSCEYAEPGFYYYF